MTNEPKHTLTVECTVNGEKVRREVPARRHLADFLREDLELTGTHLGCEHGVCGACSVLLDGVVIRSCLILAVQAHGRKIETIEGLSDSGALADLQGAFIERNAAQCGFCTPGMLITAHQLVASGEAVTRPEIREYMSGNLCRCTGYHAIVDAVEAVIQKKGQS